MIFSYSVVAIDDTFFIFGGRDLENQRLNRGNSRVIASFDTRSKNWKKLGEMNQPRYEHGVIVHQGQFFVVGGWGRQKTKRIYLKSSNSLFVLKVTVLVTPSRRD